MGPRALLIRALGPNLRPLSLPAYLPPALRFCTATDIPTQSTGDGTTQAPRLASLYRHESGGSGDNGACIYKLRRSPARTHSKLTERPSAAAAGRASVANRHNVHADSVSVAVQKKANALWSSKPLGTREARSPHDGRAAHARQPAVMRIQKPKKLRGACLSAARSLDTLGLSDSANATGQAQPNR